MKVWIKGKLVMLFYFIYEMFLSGMAHLWWRCLFKPYECEVTCVCERGHEGILCEVR